METVLDVDQAPYDANRTPICRDGAARQLLSDTSDPLPIKPGRPRCVDDKYDRHGTGSPFLFCDPVAGRLRDGVGRGQGVRDREME